MLFEKGRAKTGGRLKGARNKLSAALLEALAEDFEKHGAEAIRIARREKPTEYLKVVASLLPKEFEFTDLAYRICQTMNLMPSFNSLSDSSAILQTLEAERARRSIENRLNFYKPYEKQKAFHDAGAVHRERLFMAGNRVGKTMCGAAEMAMHLTGLYPQWWRGKRFEKPVRAWAAGVTNESARDVVQDKLMGPPFRRLEWGHGLIPKDCIGEVSMARGTADLIDNVSVRHVSDGYSMLQFKSYSEGRTKWQGVGLEVVWLDEESPEDLYFEALTRTNETGGIVYTTFTPTAGMTSVVKMFLNEGIRI